MRAGYHGQMTDFPASPSGQEGCDRSFKGRGFTVARLRDAPLRMMLLLLTVGMSGLVVGAAGCKSSGPGGAAVKEQKSFHLRGKIVSTQVLTGSISVDSGAIPGYMDAMTMSYKLVQPETLSELHPGDLITARVLVEYDSAGALPPKLDQIVVVGQARPDYKPTVQYHVPQAGDAVPNFALLNQSGKTIHLAQFRGRVVLMTFIYTRCPLADFCPRMSSNFAEIDKALAADKSMYDRTHLLSVSFDPKYDTPQVLRSYGGAHTGKFTEEDFKHWDFAAPALEELPKVEQYFDVGLTGDSSDPGSIQHSLSTVLIGKDGKVLAWYPTNDWKTGDVLSAVKSAAAA